MLQVFKYYFRGFRYSRRWSVLFTDNQWQSIVSQDTWIFTNSTVLTSNLAMFFQTMGLCSIKLWKWARKLIGMDKTWSALGLCKSMYTETDRHSWQSQIEVSLTIQQWSKSRTENLQCILITSWSPQHKRDECSGIAKGCKCEHRELEIVAEYIAHMVQKHEQQDESSKQLCHTPSTQHCHGYQQLQNLQKTVIQNETTHSVRFVKQECVWL